MLQQESYDVRVTDPGGDVEWRSLFSRWRVGVAAVAQQNPDDISLIRPSRQVERSLAADRLDVRGAEEENYKGKMI